MGFVHYNNTTAEQLAHISQVRCAARSGRCAIAPVILLPFFNAAAMGRI